MVYYDSFEQTLALQNIASMLKPGGILIANSELAEMPVVPMKAVGFTKVSYTVNPATSDRMIWYQKK